MKLFKKKVKPTGRTIDMTNTYWGHNISYIRGGKTTARFAIWVSTRPVPGDEITWNSKYGNEKGTVISVEPCSGVWDMSFINVKNIKVENETQ